MNEITFEQWMRKVDQCLIAVCGLTHYDLPDCCWRDWYDDGASPTEAAKDCLDASGYNEY